MIISQICGGLGNQMFQYALGRSLSLQHGVPLLLDLSWFESMEGCTPRRFLLDGFPALANKTVWRECSPAEREGLCSVTFWQRLCAKIARRPAQNPRHCREEQTTFKADMGLIPPPLYLDGYWQDERYFIAHREHIRQDFIFPVFSEEAQFLANCIEKQSETISVHIRRGDYIADPTINAVHGLCSSAYYAAAIARIKERATSPTLYLFSDDPAWVRANFDTQGLPATIIDLHDKNSEFEDMHLMRLCKHHIIANSSFSWWGAWLSAEQGVTVAPQQWFKNPSMNTINPCPPRWARI